MRKLLLRMALCLGVFALPTAAFSQAEAIVTTCSGAYGLCFDACSTQFPGGTDASAKCIDKCAMARAKCDRNGCFNAKSIAVCGLAKE
jgi:hypothetical protein